MNIMEERIPFRNFIKILSNYELIILGEIHGTKEIPFLIKKIIQNLSNKINFIFLEIPKNQQAYIEKYFMLKSEKYLYEIPFFKNPSKDGRGSKENLLLIKSIKEMLNKHSNEMRIVCIDSNKNINRDYFMYKEIRKCLKHEKKGINILLTGNLHAITKKVVINKKKLKPCGYYLKKWLKEDIISVNFVAMQGKFFNLKIQEVSNKKARQEGIFYSKIKGYDLEYRIKMVSPCNFL